MPYKNKEDRARNDKIYRIKNKARKNALKVKWHHNNRKKALEINNKSFQKYKYKPHNILKIIKGNAKKRGRKIDLTKEIFVMWYNKQIQTCAYCGIKASNLKKYNGIKRLTIDRIDNSQGYLLKNITLACALCNKVKSDIFTAKEMCLLSELIRKKWRYL